MPRLNAHRQADYLDTTSNDSRGKQRYKHLVASGYCPTCEKKWWGSTVLCESCKSRRRQFNNTRRDRRNLKTAALAAYGGQVCKCCGETEYLFLTLDHVNNDGTQHRQDILGLRKLSGWGFYQKLKSLGWPNDPPLQVLCYNCNNGKRVNKGICPHQQPLEQVA